MKTRLKFHNLAVRKGTLSPLQFKVISMSREFLEVRRGQRPLPNSETTQFGHHLNHSPIGFSALLFIMLLCPGIVEAQRPGEPSVRDTVERLSRIDTNRAAELQVIRANKNTAERYAIQKQVIDDFKDLQLLNNKMMADAWSQSELDYKYLAGMIGQIAKRATRLKTNLALPRSSTDSQTKTSDDEVSTPKEFKDELLSLDGSVMRFVTNPIFKTTTIIELKLADQASRDLDAVVDLCKKLKKVSARLSKSSKS